MEIYKLLGLCLCLLIVLCILREYNPSYWTVAALACGAVVLFYTLRLLGPVLAFVQQLADLVQADYIGVVFKAAAIAILTQGVQDSCAQAGQTVLAGHVELIGKTAVLLAALPLLRMLTDTLLALLQ